MAQSPLERKMAHNAPQATPDRPKAYSYVRFSTPEQAQGDSYRRQTEQASAYAEANALELAELTFRDLGASAFRGKNAETGALRAFLKAVEDEEIPSGSYLLVESLDRITRNSIIEAQALFMLIVRAGITIVTLQDRRAYSAASINANPAELIVSIALMMRAHDESATKSFRLSRTYEQKRKVAASGKPQDQPFTRMLPAWLLWHEEKRHYEVVENRARILRDIFTRADAGWSKHRIAHALNQAGIEPWGIGKRKGQHWHSSYIQKLLTNSAVVGTFTPHRVTKSDTGARKRIPQAAVENYFPAAVDRDLFARVSAQAKARASRGKHADTAARSIFAGLIRCARCEGSVTRVPKGEHVYLICTKAHARAGCKYLAVPYANAEHAVRENVKALVHSAPRGLNTAEIETEIERRANEVWILVDQTRELTDIAATEKSEAARRRLREREAELERAEEHLRHLRARRDTLASAGVQRRLEAIEHALTQKHLNASDANKALKQAVSRIVMDAEDGTLTFHWHHAEQPSEPIYFVSRHKRWNNTSPEAPA